jgi:hypothetical protein
LEPSIQAKQDEIWIANAELARSPAHPFYLAQQAEMMGFISSILVILALLFLISPHGRRYGILLWGFLSVLGCMLLLKGKFYYVAPVYPVVFAPGAVLFERLTGGARRDGYGPLMR